MPSFSMKRNDHLPSLKMRLVREGGAAVDLTTAVSVHLKAATPIAINGACSVVDAAGGIVQYDWAAGNTDVAGQFQAEVEVLWPGNKPETFPSDGYIILDILADLG